MSNLIEIAKYEASFALECRAAILKKQASLAHPPCAVLVVRSMR